MIRQELLRGQVVQVNMYNLNRTVNSKAVFNQKDVKTATIICQLNMDDVMDLTDCAVSAEILKPDNTTVIQKAQVLDAKSGIVAVGLTEQCLSAIGTVQCELVIQTENQILYSPKISYTVVDNLFDVEGVESTDELPVLNVLIAEVLKVQKELTILETTVLGNESIRESQEEERKANELIRQEEMKTIKSDFEEMVELSDEKVEEVNNKITEINNRISEINSTLEVALGEVDKAIEDMESSLNDKIKDVDDTLESTVEEINDTLDGKVKEVNLAIRNMDSSVVSKIAEIDSKLREVDTTIANINKVFENKLQSVDETLQDKLTTVDESLNNKLSQITKQVNDKIANYDSKILEINNKLTEVDNKIAEVNTKVSGYNAKVTEVNNLISAVNSAESSRVQAENNRTTTFNNIVAELEVTQTDIDDILGMIGGL